MVGWGTRVVRRLVTFVLSGAVAATVMVGAAAGPAQAQTPCFPDPAWIPVYTIGDTWVYESYTFSPVISSTPTFNVSDTRVAINNLTNPINVTFTSSVSRTFTLGVTASMQAKLGKYLLATVSATITVSRTTQIGVSVNAPVPPLAGVKGEYGVQAFNVELDITTERMHYQPFVFPPVFPPMCYSLGTERVTVNAPTVNEGWLVSPL